jgi:hypothetical protein
MKTVIKLICIVFLTSGICSCNKTAYIGSQQGAVNKYCSKDTIMVTATVHDTVILQRLYVDSVFSVKTDSIVLTKDRLVIRYQKVRDSIYLSGECQGDTIYRILEVPVKVPCNCPPPKELGFWDYLKWLGIGALIGLAFVALLSLGRK